MSTEEEKAEIKKLVEEIKAGAAPEVKFICVWCGKISGDIEDIRGCCAPDGDGHLYRREERKRP